MRIFFKSFAGRLASISFLYLGFYMIYRGFTDSNIIFGIGGGASILLGMWVITRIKRPGSRT